MNKLYGYQFSAVLLCFCLSNIFLLNLNGAEATTILLTLLPGIALVCLLSMLFKRPLDYTFDVAFGKFSPALLFVLFLYFTFVATLCLAYYGTDTVSRQLEQVPSVLLIVFVALCATYAARKQSCDIARSATIITVVAGLCFTLAAILEFTSGITQNLFIFKDAQAVSTSVITLIGVQFAEISAVLVLLPFLEEPKKQIMKRTLLTTAIGGVLCCIFAFGASALQHSNASGFFEQSSSYAGTVTLVKLLIVGSLFFFIVFRLSIIIFAAGRCLSFVTKKDPKPMALICGGVCTAIAVALSTDPTLPNAVYSGFYSATIFLPFVLLVIMAGILFAIKQKRT